MRRQGSIWFSMLLAGATLAPASALAQDAGLYHAQSGTLLTYAETETRVLYAVLTAQEFDVELTRSMVEELKRSIADAKKSVDRSTALLSESQQKLAPDFQKLREGVKAAEDQVVKLAADIQTEVKARASDDDSNEGEPVPEGGAEAAEKEKGPPPNWQLLKDGAGWLAIDLAAARSLHAKLAKSVKMPALAGPPKPKTKR